MGRSNYGREENTFDFSLSIKPSRRHLSVAFTAGYLQLNIDPGKSRLYISSEQQYPPTMATGINQPTDYLRTGLLLRSGFTKQAEGSAQRHAFPGEARSVQ